ncbi:hypothetical protein DH2020_042560 [Rehmannia glutinosa]|uniref:Protein kinase domain-containing protein n=1 Tax=Rehmannia glutinosa TaxID=99300 RepID=A0ABR0UM33_REHGL
MARITIKKKSVVSVAADYSARLKKSQVIPNDSSSESCEFIRRHKRKRMGLCKSRDLISDCGSVDEYKFLNEISHGSFGAVYRARHRKTREIVAVKEVFDGLCFLTLREIDIIKSLDHHPSIVEFKQVVVDDDDGVYIVMECVEKDLNEYMKRPFSVNEIKCLMKELLEGVKYLHQNRVMHRDLKPSNILINSKGKLKICDFGLSRQFGSMMEPYYSPCVGTLQYRAPELLVGANTYLAAVDMWSVGCIMAELFLKQVLFKGESELEQLQMIYQILGSPDGSDWPRFSNLTWSKEPQNILRDKFTISTGGPILSEVGFDLLHKLLTYDPLKRITPEDALKHGWFDELSS